ncbi:MAG: D-alanine--D-alanine ligase [Rhodobacteraceae bacterium]|nr:D-alanine--D-alanine ligase [Paracoccaceae bacterium]
MTEIVSSKVAVIKGGKSLERDVSLVTGEECATALRDEGYEVLEIDADLDLAEELSLIKPDVVFNALHGRWGEDGCVQGILEWLRIPYTHSGVLASSLAMNKQYSKQVFKQFKLPIANSQIISTEDIKTGLELKLPYVIKPTCEGSSLGVQIISKVNQDLDINVFDMGMVMAEDYIPGRELSASVLDNQALSLGEIITDNWYDYEAKYTKGMTSIEIPAKIPDDVADRCLEYALIAHQGLGCKGLSRTDFRWDDRKGVDGLVILETNTQPGMTPVSQAPKHAQVKNIGFGELCRRLVEGASCNR